MSVRKHEDGGGENVVLVEVPERSKSFLWSKRIVQRVFDLVVFPRRVAYTIGGFFIGRRAFGAASESIARVPGTRGVYLRQAFYRKTLASCGHDVYFGWNSVFSMSEAEVGDEVYIGRFCSIGYGVIGRGVMLADGVQILSGGSEHGDVPADGKLREQTQVYSRICIGPHAWLGAGAVIMADVGEGAIVGAGAVVTNPVPPMAVAVGVPARVIRDRRD